jgi:hypothetical protein
VLNANSKMMAIGLANPRSISERIAAFLSAVVLDRNPSGTTTLRADMAFGRVSRLAGRGVSLSG